MLLLIILISHAFVNHSCSTSKTKDQQTLFYRHRFYPFIVQSYWLIQMYGQKSTKYSSTALINLLFHAQIYKHDSSSFNRFTKGFWQSAQNTFLKCFYCSAPGNSVSWTDTTILIFLYLCQYRMYWSEIEMNITGITNSRLVCWSLIVNSFNRQSQ